MRKKIPIESLHSSYNNESELTLEQIEIIILEFHKKNICTGVNIKHELAKFKTAVTYIDPLNKWRLNNCFLLLPKNEIVCFMQIYQSNIYKQ